MSYCHSFFFSSRRRHTRYIGDWSSDVCSSDLAKSRRSAHVVFLPGANLQNQIISIRTGNEIRSVFVQDLFERRSRLDRKSTRLNSSHRCISYAVFCLKKQTMLSHELFGC